MLVSCPGRWETLFFFEFHNSGLMFYLSVPQRQLSMDHYRSRHCLSLNFGLTGGMVHSHHDFGWIKTWWLRRSRPYLLLNIFVTSWKGFIYIRYFICIPQTPLTGLRSNCILVQSEKQGLCVRTGGVYYATILRFETTNKHLWKELDI
jgi:hypothetical protein